MRSTRADILLIIALVAVGGFVGMSSADRNPAYIDEITYARLGYSLSEGHLASDSSFLTIYQQFGLVTDSIPTPYGHLQSVQPWLDHPPLVGILLIPFVTNMTNPRILVVAFDVAIAVALYLTLRPKDRLTAILASAFFLYFVASTPLITMLFLDSAVSFFFVLTLALLVHYSTNESSKWLYLAGMSAGLAALSKIPGVSAIVLLVVFLGYEAIKGRVGKWKAIPPILMAIGLASIWPIYGFLTEPGLFWQLINANASRSTFSGTSFVQIVRSMESSATFTKPSYVQTVDSLMQISWITMLASIAMTKYRGLALALGPYLAVLIFLDYAPPQMTIPIFPFFALGLGVVVGEISEFIARRVRTSRSSHPI